MQRFFFLLLFFFLSCGYKSYRQEAVSIYIPYIEGDKDGALTANIIEKLSENGLFSYDVDANYILKAKVVSFTNGNIGYRKDRDGEGKVKKDMIAIEGRAEAKVEFQIENAIGKLFKRKWKIVGKCRRDGRCCKDIGIIAKPWIIKYKYIFKMVLWWYTRVYPFCFKYYIEKENILIFGCTKLNNDGTCSIYNRRPSICRRYPIVSYFEKPVLFDDCGFKTELNR